tara:strand:- start:179 stop:2458 length:2280 start_codon:yes stop_codon:yes gene_type:complete
MAETLISPGVLARENDQSFVTSQPVERGAAIIGPAVLGPVEKPILISSFSSYQAIFGGALESGSGEFTYLTSIAANQYFQNGGNSLLVTRVTSGSFTSAVSSPVFNEIESGVVSIGTNLLSSYTSGGTGGTAPGTFDSVATVASPAGGTALTVNVVTSRANGKLVDTADALLASITTPTADGVDNTYTLVSLTGGTGTGAVATVVVSGNAVNSITITTPGSGYVATDTLTVPFAIIGGTVDVIITLVADDILVETTAVTAAVAGAGYAVGDTVTVAAANIGITDADLVLTLTAADIINSNAFTLETISEGVILNTGTTEITNGALVSGSTDNIRWEIAASNSASGVFSLLIRRGDDTNNNKVILESYNNISLDPFASNYISRAIGDISTNLITEGADTFLQESGSFPNISNYVRVKSVNDPTPRYFNNDGSAKAQFTSSMPQIGSGSFNGAVGSNIPVGRPANFYQNINATDTQGLVGSDYDNAIALLANQDDYQFNVISVPGLSTQHQTAQITSVMNNSISRGDSIAVIDLVGYNQPINAVTQQAGGIDNSYTATYWPWLQTVDPNSGQLVYIPASTFIPGVYAFTDASSDPWFAPAGITRGGMGQVVRAERKLTSTNRDTLYEANVNPIATFPSQGVVVFGQKTLQKAASALDRVNVRRLLITLKGYISQIADNLVFEQNTIATRQNFLTQVNPYLESVQQRQGLYAFKVVMDESNNSPDVIDRNELVGQIFLQPTRTAEFILLDFNVLPTGATFPS